MVARRSCDGKMGVRPTPSQARSLRLARTRARRRRRRPATVSPSAKSPSSSSQRERVLEQTLDRTLERAGAVGGIPALLGEELLRRVASPRARSSAPRAARAAARAGARRSRRAARASAPRRRRPRRSGSGTRAGTARAARSTERMFEVMITTVLRKSTVRPWPSVSRPSSSSWRRTSNTSVCAFSISSSRSTAYGPATHGLGELAALLVADVAGRRADEPRDRVPLLVLGHVEPDDRALVVEHELGERARELRLPDAGRAEEDERADRPVRVLEAGARAAERVRDGLDRRVLADDPLVQPLLHVDELLDLALEEPRDRNPRPRGDDGRDVVLVDLLLHHRRLGRLLALVELLSSSGRIP